MWRDPLDDLIDQLETSVPTPPVRGGEILPTFVDLQWAVAPLIWGCSEERLALHHADPRFQLVMDQLAAALRTTRARESGDA